MKRFFAAVSSVLHLVLLVLHVVVPLILVLSIVGMMGSCVAGTGTVAFGARETLTRSKGLNSKSEEQAGKYFFFMYICFMTALVSGGITWFLLMIADEIENKK
jgi:glycopeptide antibiotics resistance protein